MKNRFLQSSISVLFFITSITVHAQSWSLTGNSGTNAASNFVGTKDSKALIIKTNNKERIHIDANGYIGIGITNPQAKLNIAGLRIDSLGQTSAFMIGDKAATNLAFDYQQIQARYNGQGATLRLNQLGGNVWLGSNGSGFPALWTNADGRVGIGTNYALATGYAFTVEPLHFGNGIYVNDPGNGYSFYTVKTGNYNAAVHVQAPYTYTAAIEAFTHNAQRAIYGEDSLNGNGVEGRSYGGNAVVGVSAINVGILGIAPTYAGYFDGNVYATGVFVSSDETLKKNINDFVEAMDIIKQLHPKNYLFRNDGEYKFLNLPTGMHYGLIAQDVEKVLPGLVKDTKFDTKYAKLDSAKNKSTVVEFKALNYTELIPVIIKGMQELQQVNEQQSQQIQQQQQQINDLQKTIATLSNSNVSATKYTAAYLLQNSPNPFSQNTTIGCYVPTSVKQAQLVLYNAAGKSLQSYSLKNTGFNTITINANTLASGEYTCSLLVDGNKADSKHMILTK